MDNKPVFWKTTLSEVNETLQNIKRGKVSVLAKSAGNRDIYLIEYGQRQYFNRTANYSSACGANEPKCYADKTGKKPVIFIVGAVHAGEMEGVAAIINFINIIETGKDFMGETNTFLQNCIDKCRLIIIPVANPDGRARIPIDTMHGITYEEFRHYGQGRWKDGTLCDWPQCKKIHPIKNHVSYLGSYYNDDGINMMHDNFFGETSNETKAVMNTAETEAPDFTVLLHGGGNMIPAILETDYAPMFIKQKIRDLSLQIKEAAVEKKLPYSATAIHEDNFSTPKSFNLASALHHICGATAFVYESNQGINYGERNLNNWETILSYEDILHEHYILFEQIIRFAL
ncbi:MAG: hypothetical protein FWF92_00755 [Oscillospiraceae bacterium]|nr:hypothetical protein [Oscillospiraceae bacterium]